MSTEFVEMEDDLEPSVESDVFDLAMVVEESAAVRSPEMFACAQTEVAPSDKVKAPTATSVRI
jgi:uncharacterized metal-binding protein YceD (DUF177 family)